MDCAIKGKTALVLSAGGGLGRAISLSLALEGVSVALADINEAAVIETGNQVEACGVRAIAGVVDLMDASGLGSFVDRVGRELGCVDILVNISGGPPPSTAAKVSPGEWCKQFQAMVMSFIQVTDLVIPDMRAKKWGRIITSTSSGVLAPIPNLGISNTLRSALVGWSKTLASEVAADGITVNIVIPGRIATGRTRQLDEARAKRECKSLEEVVRASTTSIPMHRYGEPEEFASAVTFLASNRASYITGTMIRVDGGMIQSV
jgi:3-oxoacyl-[acyl-carrier protein] reductase